MRTETLGVRYSSYLAPWYCQSSVHISKYERGSAPITATILDICSKSIPANPVEHIFSPSKPLFVNIRISDDIRMQLTF